MSGVDWELLVARVVADFGMHSAGVHGLPHWQRVERNGEILCPLTGANLLVVRLFAYLHDARRENDAVDREHGARSAAYARRLHGEYFRLDDDDLALLLEAIRTHNGGTWHADVTVRTCWDADRLDLYRIGFEVDPRQLVTEAGRRPEVMEGARQRALAWCRGR